MASTAAISRLEMKQREAAWKPAGCRFNDPVDLGNAEIDKQPVRFKKGFDLNRDMEIAPISEEGISRITIRELERVEVDLGVVPGGKLSGYLLVGTTHRPLPIGSTLDDGNGIF